MLACLSLSPVWNFSFRSYGKFKSKFSLLPDTEFGEQKYVFKVRTTRRGSSPNPAIDARARYLRVATDSRRCCASWATKQLYTDTVVYYLGMAALTILGAFGSPEALRRRLRVPGVERFRSIHPYPEGATVGELLVVLGVFCLYVWWLWFWRWGYDRIYTEGEEAHKLDNKWDGDTNLKGKCCIEYEIPVPSNCSDGRCSWEQGNAGTCESRPDTPGFGGTASLHIWARVLGHMTSLSCSLLLLPATKNSAWFAVLGVPFERALKYLLWRIGLLATDPFRIGFLYCIDCCSRFSLP